MSGLTDKIQELVAFHIQRMESDESMAASIDALIVEELKLKIKEVLQSPEIAEKLRSLVNKRLTEKVVTDAVTGALTRG